MGEIKSTLDLVMEKTQHLSLSKDEKKAQQKRDTKNALKGLILKYRDQIIRQDRFEKELFALSERYGIDARPVLAGALLDEIDPDRDNAALISLLKDVCKIDTTPLGSVLDDYGKQIAHTKETRAAEMKAQLLNARGISGSAVCPNLEDDADWAARQGLVKADCRKRLEREIAKIRTD